MESLAFSYYATYATKVDEKRHRSKIIIRRGECKWFERGWYFCPETIFAEFASMRQFRKFLRYLGVRATKRQTQKASWGGKVTLMTLSHKFEDEVLFWSSTLHKLPKEKKPIKLLSNGSVVDGYIWNDGQTVHFYRPNGNDPLVYQPLSVADHVAWQRKHGSY